MIVRFGPFTLDGARRQLSREGSTVHLTPKAFELMRLLADEAPRVVSKNELHARLWPGTFVSDATLVGLVKELRRALDDHDRDSPMIRTAPRVGYALTLDVHESPAPRPIRPGHWLVLRGRRVALQDGENIVGRDPSAHVWLDAAGVSRRHARIVVDAGEARLEDLGSKNGTTVQNSPVTGPVAVMDGDRIVFGSTPCDYRSSAGTSTETRSRGVPPASQAGRA
jgi:DNA-binding winged helix-turn-helix (wHTH) protein